MNNKTNFKHLSKKGGIKMETVALFLLIVAGYFGDVYFSRFGEYWGYAGILIGPALLLFVIHGIAWLERHFIIGEEPLPVCRCGAKPINELKDARDALPYVLGKGTKVCTCGTYIINRGIIQHKIGNAEPITYATWSHGKWNIKQEES